LASRKVVTRKRRVHPRRGDWSLPSPLKDLVKTQRADPVVKEEKRISVAMRGGRGHLEERTPRHAKSFRC